MGVSTNIVARRNLIEHDLELVEAFNALFKAGYEPPEDIVRILTSLLGKDAVDEAMDIGHFYVDENGIFETNLYGRYQGNPEYGDGAIIPLDILPPGTIALRIYMSH